MPILGKEEIFLHMSQTSTLADPPVHGDSISFGIGYDKHGKPMAIELTPTHDSKGGKKRTHTAVAKGAGESAVKHPAQQAARRFQAPVKSYNGQNKFGFLLCEDLIPIVGKADIFVHQSQLTEMGGLQVGAMMEFSLGHGPYGKRMAVDLAYAVTTSQLANADSGWSYQDERYVALVKSFNRRAIDKAG